MSSAPPTSVAPRPPPTTVPPAEPNAVWAWDWAAPATRPATRRAADAKRFMVLSPCSLAGRARADRAMRDGAARRAGAVPRGTARRGAARDPAATRWRGGAAGPAPGAHRGGGRPAMSPHRTGATRRHPRSPWKAPLNRLWAWLTGTGYRPERHYMR